MFAADTLPVVRYANKVVKLNQLILKSQILHTVVNYCAEMHSRI